VARETKVALCFYEVVYLFCEVVYHCGGVSYHASRLPGDVVLKLPSAAAKLTPARAHAICTELGETKIRDLSIMDYFNKMTSLADTLASIGQPLRSETSPPTS
jgi:hypothetical protein